MDDDRGSVARALVAARKAAGFETAEAAAVHFSWPLGRYRAHESGSRRVLPDDLSTYALGFGISVRSLSHPDDRKTGKTLEKIRERDRLVALRLRAARILRGHRSASQAAPVAGIKTPTYLKHENGENRFGPDVADVYASAFGISSGWLRDGQLPSGLGRKIDGNMRAVLASPELYIGLAEAGLPTLPSDDPVDLPPGRPSKRTAKIAEYRWSDIEDAGGDLPKIVPHGLMAVPLLDSESFDGEAFSVVVDRPGLQFAMFTRLIVSRHLGSGECLVNDRGLKVVTVRNHQESKVTTGILGRLVARIDSVTFG